MGDDKRIYDETEQYQQNASRLRNFVNELFPGETFDDIPPIPDLSMLKVREYGGTYATHMKVPDTNQN